MRRLSGWLVASALLASQAAPAGAADGVRWICAGTSRTGTHLVTRFGAGSVVIGWQGNERRLAHVAGDDGTRYAGADGGEAAGWSLWLREDDVAVLTAGDRTAGCRAERRNPNLPMPEASDSSPLALATALVAGAPERLAELASVVGPIPRDRSLWYQAVGPLDVARPDGSVASIHVELSIDIFHQDPVEEADPRLAHWQVGFRGGDAGVRELLRSHYGEGRELAHTEGRSWRFGPFYWTPATGDGGFQLAWWDLEPEWAVPPRDAAAEAREIARVERLLAGGVQRSDLEKEFGPLGPDQWGSSVLGETPSWRVQAWPADGPVRRVDLLPRGGPIPAGSLLGALGLEMPVVLSHDVHLQSRTLEDREHGMPKVGDYQVDIAIDHHDLDELERPAEPDAYFYPAWTSKTWPITAITIERPDER